MIPRHKPAPCSIRRKCGYNESEWKVRPISGQGASSKLMILVALIVVLVVSIFGVLEYTEISSLQGQNRTLSDSVTELGSSVSAL